MADRKLTDLTAQTASGLALPDLLLTSDLSDTTDDASGTYKKMTVADYQAGVRTLLVNQSVASQSPFSSDTYLVGSREVFPSGYPVVGTSYRCIFDVTKTAAGTATPIINVRLGTAGTTADTARCTFTFGAGTAAADVGIFEVICTFRTVGGTTSAVLQGIARLTSNLTTTGLSNAAKARVATSAGFDSTVANLGIGVSYNGGASAAHTIQLVRSELIL